LSWRQYSKPIGYIIAAVIAALAAIEVLGRVTNVFAKVSWVNSSWSPITTLAVGADKTAICQVPSWFNPTSIVWTSSDDGVLPSTAWPASTNNTFVQQGGPAAAAGSITLSAVVTGKVIGIVPLSVKSNSATLTVN